MAKKINLSHFAFYRGWLEGLDLADLGDRYLPTGRDLPEAKKTLRWMQDELVAAAKRSKPFLARVLRLTPAQLQNLTTAPSPAGLPDHLPTLEDFRAEVDPDGDFYTEAQLIEQFQENYRDRAPADATRKAERNARLIKRLREVITWLEGWVAVSPQKEDPVDSWLAESLAERLRSHKLNTLGDLVSFIQRYGSTWHRRVEKIGPIAATRLERWLEENHLWSHASLPSPNMTPTLVMDIVPLERLLVPDDLSGTNGSNRLFENRIDARDDFSAVNAWLAAQPPVANTQRAYRSQAERFLLWMLFERGKPLSSANTDDCIAYREFLNSLEEGALWFWHAPRERWVGSRATPRSSPDWRPFTGPLVPRSQKQAVSILTSMFSWLVKRRYLDYNPWDGVSVNYTTTVKIRVDHSLTLRQWSHCLDVLKDLPDDEKSHRTRTLLWFAYGTGVRLSELTSLKTAAPPRPGTIPVGLVLRPDEDGVYGWEADVIGKGNKHRSLSVTQEVLEALQAYGQTMGRPPLLEDWPPNTPVFMSLGDGGWRVKLNQPGVRQPLSESQVYRILKEFFAWAASKCANRADQEHLAQASTHWLRHTYATHTLQTEEGELTVVQESLGHASAATTAIYTHSNRRQRRAAASALMALSNKARSPK